MSDPANGGTATIKDVYAAVDNVRTELGGKIDKLADTVNTVVTSHEHRITVAEQAVATQSERLLALEKGQKEHSDEIATIKDTQREKTAKKKALADAKASKQSTRRWIVGTLIAILGVLASVAFILTAG